MTSDPKDARRERLAAAMRENLKRRKAQARQRRVEAAGNPATGSSEPAREAEGGPKR